MKYNYTFWSSLPLLGFPQNVISMFTYAVINIRYEKISETCFSFVHVSVYCFDSRKQSSSFSSVFNMCLFYMHFRQEKALQSKMVIVRFSPRTVSPPRCHLKLPLQARATVLRARFFSARADKVLFCFGACRLSAEKRWAYVSEVSDKKSTSENFESEKQNDQLKKTEKKKLCQPHRIKNATRVCISMNQSVGRGNTQ